MPARTPCSSPKPPTTFAVYKSASPFDAPPAFGTSEPPPSPVPTRRSITLSHRLQTYRRHVSCFR